MTPWMIACQASLPMEFSRQEYWSGLTFPSPGDLPDPGVKTMRPILQEDSSLSVPPYLLAFASHAIDQVLTALQTRYAKIWRQLCIKRDFLVAQMVKNLPAIQETRV